MKSFSFAVFASLLAATSLAQTFTPIAEVPCASHQYILQPATLKRNPKAVSASQAAALAAHPDPFVIDTFDSLFDNNLGLPHYNEVGTYDIDGKRQFLNASTKDVDAYFSTSLSQACFDLSADSTSYLHITYSGSRKFSVTLNQNNRWCNSTRIPYPETMDSVEAARYSWERDAKNADYDYDLYVPLSHFFIDLKRVTTISLEGFYSQVPTFIYKIEIVKDIPNGSKAKGQGTGKLSSGTVFKTCTEPNLVAFGIDDGNPKLAQRAMQVIKDEQVPVTFFVQGMALEDKEANFTNVYKEMHSLGHQIALHSYNHSRLEALSEDSEIDYQYRKSREALYKFLSIKTDYFRPPFGTLGARTRQRLAQQVMDPKIVLWSIDVADWRWGNSTTPEKELQLFEKDLNAGGDIVVIHYLHENTLTQLRDMIRLAKSKGKKIVRMDQCLGQRSLKDTDQPKSWPWAQTTKGKKSEGARSSNPVRKMFQLARGLGL